MSDIEWLVEGSHIKGGTHSNCFLILLLKIPQSEFVIGGGVPDRFREKKELTDRAKKVYL
jgi:hypothetical protein